MPLQIAFSWTHATDRINARALVQAMRDAALKLPCTSVGEILEDSWGSEQTRDPERRRDPDRPRMTDHDLERHFVRWPGRWFVQNSTDNEADGELIEPVWTCYFTAELLNGCDPVHIGLAEHIPQVKVERESGHIVQVSTGLDGRFAWQCRVETIYAGMPQHGGWENFLRQHTTVLDLLRAIEALGPQLEVWDQGGYWETGDVDALRQELDRSSAITAHVYGAMKDELGEQDISDIAKILKHPNFEHLEAKGEQISEENTVGKRMMREAEEQMREEPWLEEHRRLMDEE